ncbi:hypothetical protein GCM10008995_25740 [Halobellus salinus]|uniref:Uncharacterized protein n=1 Tax=Halobellus salinus TaxID=931585 RepID=A0A830ERJ9_9EURY|nr:hypothetical protein [Halobellus salinus]GGJ14729.1 hypothetical protein GCM10008995_25740 [Halobellus salinus]
MALLTTASGRTGETPSVTTATAALRAWGTAVVVALGTFGVFAAISLAFPNPLAGSELLPGAVAFRSVFVSTTALPHVLAGPVFDTECGIWYVP